MTTKPLLLSPAGSPEALHAAVAAGADECYFGGSVFNARIRAKGFSPEELRDALRFLRLHGVKSHITLNTLVTDREAEEAVAFAKDAWENGADAFIVQDLGLAARLHAEIPGVCLHASTQCACHNTDGAVRLYELGFSRVVLARELSKENIRAISESGKGRFETECFVHGALCVCHSGQCLMSACIGNRSGNRGLCAQPCRLPGNVKNAAGKVGHDPFPLSLRDLSLARHIEELSMLGVASLKIEGRMKSPEYVYEVTRIFRELLDSGKNADDAVMRRLADLFSRGGAFTDGYFTQNFRRDNRAMYGYRRDADKEKTERCAVTVPDAPKLAVDLTAVVKRGEAPYLRLSRGDTNGEARLASPVQSAQNAPLTEESLLKNLSKLGSTPFVLRHADVELDDGVFLAASEINALRRDAADALERALCRVPARKEVSSPALPDVPLKTERTKQPKLRFFTSDPAFTPDAAREVEPVESLCLPLELFRGGKRLSVFPRYPFGVALPRVLFDEEMMGAKEALLAAKDCGASYVYVSNIGHIDLAKEAGLPLMGGLGLNVTNSETYCTLAALGFAGITLSCELNPAQMRDIVRRKGVTCAVVGEGRLPLMVLESCILRAHAGCANADGHAKICGVYTDRIGKAFPVVPMRRFVGDGLPCRNLILNADVLHLYSKKDEMTKTGADVIEIFTE